MQYRLIDPHRFAFIKPGGLTQPLPVVVTTGRVVVLGGNVSQHEYILHETDTIDPRGFTVLFVHHGYGRAASRIKFPV